MQAIKTNPSLSHMKTKQQKKNPINEASSKKEYRKNPLEIINLEYVNINKTEEENRQTKQNHLQNQTQNPFQHKFQN